MSRARMRSTVPNSDTEMGSGAAIAWNVNLDFLVPLGIALSNDSTCREDQCPEVLGWHDMKSGGRFASRAAFKTSSDQFDGLC